MTLHLPNPTHPPSSNPKPKQVPQPTILLLTLILILTLLTPTTPGSIAPTTVIQDLPYFGSHYFKLSSITLQNTTDFGSSPKIYQRTLDKIYYKIKSSTIIFSSYKSVSNNDFGLTTGLSITTDPTIAVNVTVTQTLTSKFQIIGVSVILVASPFDTVLKFYQFDMNIQNRLYYKPYTKPGAFQIYTFMKSMSQRTYDYYYDVKTTLPIANSTALYLQFDTVSTYDSTSSNDTYSVQAVVIILDLTEKDITPSLNFLSYNQRGPFYNAFYYPQFGISVAKYGKDINKKCILGIPYFEDIYYNLPFFVFDLDALNGVTNTGLHNTNNVFQTLCFQDKSCPPEYPFKKLNDFINCWDCDGGVTNKLSSVLNCNSYDDAFASTKYHEIDGSAILYCLKCTECEDHYYADGGDCIECIQLFPKCLTCEEKVKCLRCLVGYIIDSMDTCQPCGNFLSNCLECPDSTKCTKCQTGYFLDSNKCIKCSIYMEYCSSCPSSHSCLECSYPFILNPTGNGCTCEVGRVLTGSCTTVSGCISSHIVNSATLCYACDTQNNWRFLSTFDCSCQIGYKKISDTQCLIFCGDGLWTGEQCDDGNFINDDGCSSTCLRQDLFECTNFYLQQSICRYIPQISAQVYSLSRKFGKSQVMLKLKFSPFHPIIKANDWSSNVQVNNQNITYDSFQIQDDQIVVLYYNIYNSIQNQTIKWTFSYSSNKFLSKSTSLDINMQGMNAPLSYEAYYKHEVIIEIISYIVGGLAFVIALVSMVKADSNVAFETVSTVLFIFYSRILINKDNPAMFFALSGLRIAQGFNEFFPNQHRDYQQYVSKNRFYLKSQLGLMSIFTLAIMLIILTLKVIYQVKSFYNLISFKKPNLKKTNNQQTNQKKMFNFLSKAYQAYLVVDRECFTPITIMLLYRVICTFSSFEDENHRYASNFSPLVTKVIGIIFFVVIIYYMGVVAWIISRIYNKMNGVMGRRSGRRTKVSLSNIEQTIYQFVISVLIFMMQDWRNQSENMKLQVCIGVVVVYMMVIMIYRPYERILNMGSIILNEIVKLGYLILIYMISKNMVAQIWIMIGSYMTVGGLMIIQIISIYRIRESWIIWNGWWCWGSQSGQKNKDVGKGKMNRNRNVKQLNIMNDNSNGRQRGNNGNGNNEGGKPRRIIKQRDIINNKYLYANILKQQQKQLYQEEQYMKLMKDVKKEGSYSRALGGLGGGGGGGDNGGSGMNLYQALSNMGKNRSRSQAISGTRGMGMGIVGGGRQLSLKQSQKIDQKGQLQKIKQRIRSTAYILHQKQALYRRK